ncbi:mitochondrial DNA helicase-like isoform X1 [Macrosteles quadrilineatus]|uniref:mitochondrial DNA helicase-like isoform X1 n=2 Tax=Macrosteles quadrilineatus TaxID=74068 RepID=UPI0023E34593|nr:mitochondrial DNA helicase-like isoform X1 [Macrosteles quadrilineatus]
MRQLRYCKFLTTDLSNTWFFGLLFNVNRTIPFKKQNFLRYSSFLFPLSNISLSHIKRTLQIKKFTVKDGYTCLVTTCLSCKNNRKTDGNIFINKVTGYFFCSECNASGSWDSLEKALKKDADSLPKDKPMIAPSRWTTICEKSEDLKLLSHIDLEEIVQKFQLKDVSHEHLLALDPLVNESRSHMYIPLKNCGHIVGVKELTQDGYETTIPNIECKGLLIVEGQRNSQKKEAILVHSVKDMLALTGCKIKSDIICLPHGITSLPQEILPVLEKYNKIILWFDNEEGHWESAKQFSKKLNEERCYFVRPSEDQPAPHKAHQLGRSLREIVQRATPISHQSITHFAHLREDVLAHLQNIEKAAGVKWVRFPALNNILKGHRRGEMTILTGPSGAGKTTFMSEYSLDLAMQGVTTLWGSFEIRNERLARTMLQQMCQFPLHLHLDRFNHWADLFQQLPIYFMTFYGQQPLKVVMEAVEHAAYVHDIAHVIIDNVQFMMGLSDGDNSLDRFYRQDSIIAAFRNFASTANCHVTLVIHPRKERDADMLNMNSVFGGVKATQEADNVLIIQQKTLQNLKLKKFLQIAKNRYCGDLGVMPLDFDKDSLSFSVKKGQKKETSDNNDDR